MKMNKFSIIILFCVTLIELIHGYGYEKHHLTTNSAFTQAQSNRIWTADGESKHLSYFL